MCCLARVSFLYSSIYRHSYLKPYIIHTASVVSSFVSSSTSGTMLLASLVDDLAAYAAMFTVVLLSAALLWYYKFVIKPYAAFPTWRLEFRIPYWILNRRKLDTEIFKRGFEQVRKYESEGIFVVWFLKPRVVVYGEEIIKCVIPYMTEQPWIIRIVEFAFGKGIFVSNGERWRRQKKLVSPAFHTKALKTYVSFMNSNAEALAEKLSEKKGEAVDDICHVLSECTIKLFYESSLGVKERDSKDVETSVEIMHRLVEFFVYRIFRPWLYFDFVLPVLPYARQILKLEAENRKMTVQTLEKIKETVAARDQSGVIDDPLRPKSMGEILIEDRLKLPSFSMEELAREVNFLIFAGFDTTAHTLMWTFYALGRHPEIQDRVYDEIASVVEENIQYADVRDLTYLDCVIKESLRLYPVPFMSRTVKKDVRCGNYLIPKNTEVILFFFFLHRNPKVYPDPEKFDPERFMDKNSKIKAWNYLPFAEGPRPCIGKNYALLSMKIFLIHVLRNFKVISLDREEDLTFKYSLVLGAEKEPRMKFIPRQEQTCSPDCS